MREPLATLNRKALDTSRSVVVGHLTDCGPEETVRALLLDRLGGLGVPLASGAPFGHEDRNLALPLGVPAVLEAFTGVAGARRLAP